MDKMRFETPDITAQNIEKICELFPNCITETKDENGKLKKAINFELLKQMLSGDVVEGDEAYEFTWVGKKAAIVEANKPIRKTLRPCPEESVDWEKTKNLYIEGDNLEVLKLLQESYLGKVKMIYIDPPYNTGNDFIYRDDFAVSSEDYTEQTGRVDDEGNRLFKNTDSNGRFHSDWCSMIYSRLMLARNLLTDDGVIFISIDDNEVENLKKVCGEIFGDSNFVAIVNWKGRGGRQDSKYYAAVHEYILVYAKLISNFQAGEEIISGAIYPKYDEVKKRFYKTQLLRKWGANSRREDRPNLFYAIKAPDGTDVYPMLPRSANSAQNLENFGCWRHSASTMKKNIEEGKVEFVKQNDGSWIAYEKIFAPLEGEEATKKYTTWIDETNDGTSIVKGLFGEAVFDYPKSPSLLCKFIKMANVEGNDITLDFFSGSSTTAHAVMQLNAEDSGHRKFIMVQLPELCEENSKAYNAGYKNICEIGKERIRRASAKIKEENPLTTQDLDIGFRVFKLDDSNMNDVYYSAGEYNQSMLSMLESNVKEDRTDLDLLFGCLLEWGLPLSMPYKSEKIEGCTVHTYNDGDLIACFDENIPDTVIKEIAKRQPLRAVFRDSGFADSPAKINVGEIFKMLAPDTRIKVI
ncbi:MAG: site-specific DNA-methyltransferase [Synergistes sp.]|nr:site-specific DNA-methyltransferase [Synergistes sp.]